VVKSVDTKDLKRNHCRG